MCLYMCLYNVLNDLKETKIRENTLYLPTVKEKKGI